MRVDLEMNKFKVNRLSQASTLTVDGSSIRGSDIIGNTRAELWRTSSASSYESTADLKKELAATELTHYDFNFTQRYPLHAAIRTGRIELVRKVLKSAKTSGKFLPLVVNEFDDVDLMAPIHYAAKYNQCEAATLILNYGAMISAEGQNNETALHTACRHNNFEMASLLLKKGCPVSMVDRKGQTPLHIATRKGQRDLVYEILHQDDVSANPIDQDGITPLHLAAGNGDEGICQLLILFGAKKNASTNNGTTPLHIAAANNSLNVIKLLLEGGDEIDTDKLVNAQRKDKTTPLHLASRMGYLEPARILLEKGTRPSVRSSSLSSPLHLACMNGHYGVAKLLLQKGTIVDAKNEKGETPSHLLAQFGHVSLFPLLIEYNAEINARENDNMTPLMVAIVHRQITVVEFLLFKGSIDVLQVDISLRTCLHLAVQYDSLEIVTMLMKYGADSLLQSEDKDGRTPIHYCALYGKSEILEKFIHSIWELSVKDSTGRTALHLAVESNEMECVQLLAGVVSTELLESKDESGGTPLHVAADFDHWEIANFLLAKGMDSNIWDNCNQTALHRALSKGFSRTTLVLIQHGADIEQVDNLGNTALLTAVQCGQANQVEILLEHGASVRAVNSENMNCFELAVHYRHEDVCMSIVNNARWRSALLCTSEKGQSLIKKIIATMPRVMHQILERSVVYSDHHPDDKDFCITYNFDVIDPAPNDKCNVNLAANTMVEFNRHELLLHPLTRNFLNQKWSSFGHYLFVGFFFLFFAFAVLFSTVIILDRDRSVRGLREKAENKSTTADIEIEDTELKVAYTALTTCILLLAKQLFLLILYRWRFFTLENILVSFACGLAMPVILQTSAIVDGNNEIMFQMATVDLFIVWVGVTLYLQRFKIFRGYITMYLHVTATLLKVLLVFSSLFVMFMVTFYLLFLAQDSFGSVGRTIAKILIMLTGEFEYEAFITQQIGRRNSALDYPSLPFRDLSYVFVLLFVFMMTISLMNLLIGLAVGDIEGIKKNARLKTVEHLVWDTSRIDSILPLFLRRRLHIYQHTVSPNKSHPIKRLHSHISLSQNKDGKPEIFDIKKSNGINFSMSKLPNDTVHMQQLQKRITNIEKQTDQQAKLLRRIAALPQLNCN